MPGFLIGAVVGALAASAYLKRKGASGMTDAMSRSGQRGGLSATGGRVDELSTAANTASPESGSLNAGDGTPSGSSGLGRPLSGGSGMGTGSGTGSGLSEGRY